jgi:hypothetical protein
MHDEGAIHVWPDLVPKHVPLPTPAVLQRAFDFVLPDGRCAVVALFADDALETSIVIRRNGTRIDRVWGPESLRAIVGPLGGDYRRDERVIRRAIEREIGPLAFGLFAEFDTLHDLLRDTRAGAWGEAIASRDVVLDPMPGWVAVAAGAGVLRAAAQRSQRVLTGLGILGAFSPALRRVREIAETVTTFDLEKLLGFNPLRALAEMLRHGRDQRDDRGA